MPDSPSPPLPRRSRSSTVSAWSSAVCPVSAPAGSAARRAPRARASRLGPGATSTVWHTNATPSSAAICGGRVGFGGRFRAQAVVDVVGDDVEPVPDGEGDEGGRVGAARERAGHRRSARGNVRRGSSCRANDDGGRLIAGRPRAWPSELHLFGAPPARVALVRHVLEVADRQPDHGDEPGHGHDHADPPVPDVRGEHAAQRTQAPRSSAIRGRRVELSGRLRVGRLRRVGRADDAVAVEVLVEAHLDLGQQAGRHLVVVALAADHLLELGLEVERLQAVDAARRGGGGSARASSDDNSSSRKASSSRSVCLQSAIVLARSVVFLSRPPTTRWLRVGLS